MPPPACGRKSSPTRTVGVIDAAPRQRTLRGDSSSRMPCAPGVSSGSTNDAVKSCTTAGPSASCGAALAAAAGQSAPPARGLVDFRSSGTRLELKACDADCCGYETMQDVEHGGLRVICVFSLCRVM